jgi:hypothetical protein
MSNPRQFMAVLPRSALFGNFKAPQLDPALGVGLSRALLSCAGERGACHISGDFPITG